MPRLDSAWFNFEARSVCSAGSLLAEFVAYLEKNGLVEFDALREDGADFRNRFKLQKYVFLAQCFGLDLPYRHGMYLYGSYSRELTKDYAPSRRIALGATTALRQTFRSRSEARTF